MPMGIATQIPGEVIAATWGNFVADRIVGRFATAAERDAAVTVPANGMIVWRTDLNAPEIRKGGAWVPLLRDQTRCGCALTLTNQSIGTGVNAPLVWTTELWDTDNFHAASASAIVIPTGLSGVYSLSVTIDANGTLSGASTISIVWSGSANVYPGYIPAANRYGAAHSQLEAVAGASATVSLYNGHSTTALFSAHLSLCRLSV